MIILRPATMDDCDILWTWRNEYKPLSQQDHDLWLRQWMARHLLDARQGLYIAEVEGVPVGTGRITSSGINCTDLELTWCHIHYFIARGERNNGYGTQLVRELVRKAHSEMGYETVSARIHRDNRASLQCALMGGVTAVEFL